MTLIEQIEKYFEKEKLLDAFVRYELYYHLGLGRLVYLSIQDLDETYKKIEELDLAIDSNIVINTLYYILQQHYKNTDFDEKFDYYIRASAMSQALQEFAFKDEELNNPELFTEQMHEEIFNDRIFNEELKEQFDKEYDHVYAAFSQTITEDIANQIKETVLVTYEHKDMELK